MKPFKKNKNLIHPIYSILCIMILTLTACDNIIDALTGASKPISLDGNSYYHQTDVTLMDIGKLEITGEIKKPGIINIDDYYTREVYVKEIIQTAQGDSFIGAYRYRGYSLFDLLHPYNQNKKNAESFKPATDLYIIIENNKGEHVVFSWAEIFFVNNPHQIIIATESAPIVPMRKEVDYPVAKVWKVIAATDLYAYRVLENPSKIKVISFDKKNYSIEKGMEPMYSPEVNVVVDDKLLINIPEITDSTHFVRYYSCFYGMGMGYHPVPYFQGPLLNSFIKDSIDLLSPELIKHGLVSFVGLDGYRAVFSFCELFNRADQTPAILSIVQDKLDGGYYRFFHPSYYYADMSVKGLTEIYFFKE